MYRSHAASLIQTGGGVDPDKAEAGDNAHHKYSDCYIPASGPDVSTTERAKNIWRKFKLFLVVTLQSDLQCIEQIIINFPYFPELHCLLSTCPNFNPPALTTGVGPCYDFSPLPDTRFTNLCTPSPFIVSLVYALPPLPLLTCFIP